jgi:ABC-type molybdenum transport system ATPase subunit/photorepair protein PhrA
MLSAGRIRSLKPLLRADAKRLESSAQEHRQRDFHAGPGGRETAKTFGEVLLRLAHVDLYVEHQQVLRDVNWQLRRGEHWAIFGPNGAGKSSFLKLLYGDLSPALGGRIERLGFPPGTPIMQWKRQVGYVSPELQSTYALGVSIVELVASGRHASIGLVNALTPGELTIALRWLRFFKLLKFAQRRPRELSYGQLRRALIARAMAAEARILLLDEPLTGLDPAQRALMKRLLERLMQHGVTVIAAVHHAEDLPRGITHALHLHKRQAHIHFAT